MTTKTKKLISYGQLDNLSYSSIFNLYKNHVNKTRVGLLGAFGSGRVLVKSASGSRIKLKNGLNILDATGGFGVLNHGHNHPRILKARKWCQDNFKMEVNKSFLSPSLAVLSHNICCLLPKNLQYAFFPNSGSESIDVAIRLALKYHEGKKNKILYSDRAFHGKSMGPQSISNSGENPLRIPTILNTAIYKFNDKKSIEQKIKNSLDSKGDSSIAAIIIEPFSASTLTETSEDFLMFVRTQCTHYKIILIFDEVYSGFFKTGPLFNFMRCKNLSPDILCFAKALGGGKSSIAAVVYSKNIADKSLHNTEGANFLSSTYYGFYEECVTAIEAIQIAIDENYEEKSNKIHKAMTKLANEIKNLTNGEVTMQGKGTLWGLFYNKDLTLTQTIISHLPISFKNDKSFAKKIYLSAAINWLFEKKNILAALSFGFNTHILISLNFAYTDKDLKELRSALIEISKKRWELFLPKFVANKFIKSR
jgi:putrescine aminotransferase